MKQILEIPSKVGNQFDFSASQSPAPEWFRVTNVEQLESPALLLYPDRIEENIRRMVTLVGTAARLRPHVKTHKLAEVASRQIAAGISKFKVATIAEAEMMANIGVPDLLIAYQPVGPNAGRLVELIKTFPKTSFACVIDDLGVGRELSRIAHSAGLTARVLLDVDCGQRRTGIPPDAKAVELYRELSRLPGLELFGLHAYDGHLNQSDSVERKRECDQAFTAVSWLLEQLRILGLPAQTVVCGGTPTFPIHATREGVECSPGTCVFWDFGYSSRLADLDFLHAALVLTRVVSKPGPGRLCLDLGHKAIASENPHPRVYFLNAPDAKAVSHSEEHLVVEIETADQWHIGECLYGVPWHICPTVALYSEAVAVQNGKAVERWPIAARARRLTV